MASQPPSPDRTSSRPHRYNRRSFSDPIKSSLDITPIRPSPSGARPRTAPGPPLDARLPAGARVIHTDCGRPSVMRGMSMNDLALSTKRRDEPISASPVTPTHARSRSFTASAKLLARKASGKLRSMTTRSSTAPPLPTADEQAWRAIDLSRSTSDRKEKGRGEDGPGLAASTREELTPVHMRRTPTPTEHPSASRRASSPHISRQRSISKATRYDGEQSPEKRSNRASSPVMPRRKSASGRSSPTLETSFVRRAISRKKSSASLPTSASSPSLYSAPPDLPTCPPHIALFPFELQTITSSSVECKISRALDAHVPTPRTPDWPPKRTSSTRRPPSPPTTPSLSLSSSLSAISMLSSPAQTAERGASFDSSRRLRFPSSFGFVGRPSDDLLAPHSLIFPPAKPSVSIEAAPAARENAASVPRPLDADKEAERTRQFEALLRGSSERVIRKTLTPKVAGTTPRLPM